MAPLNTARARVVDPVLTHHARGYQHPDRKGLTLAPRVECPKRGVKRIEFGKESFLVYETERAAGANVREIQFGFDAQTVNLAQHALAAKTPIEFLEESSDLPGVDLQMQAVTQVQDIISLRLERRHAEVLADPASYSASNVEALGGSDQWSHEDSDPAAVVSDAVSTIRRRIGMRPNTLLLGGEVYDKLRWHPKLQERFKYTTSQSVTAEMMAAFFDLKRVEVADAVYAQRAAGDFIDVWGRAAILAYVAPDSDRSMARPSFAYTYRLRNHPIVERAYYEQGVRSWINQVIDEWSVEIVGKDAGFLIRNAVAEVLP